ncbi:hypothetical protein GW755_03050 [bacterium]|nr:hypothetical protein [bacterium]
MPDEILPLEEDLMSSFSARQAKIINWLDKRPEKGAGDEMSELRAKKNNPRFLGSLLFQTDPSSITTFNPSSTSFEF